MKKAIQPLRKKRARIIIVCLLLLNALGFYTAYALQSNKSSQSYSVEMAEISSDDQAVDYLDGGWRMINWGAKLLKYFREGEPAN
jgi:hypothetical protein